MRLFLKCFSVKGKVFFAKWTLLKKKLSFKSFFFSKEGFLREWFSLHFFERVFFGVVFFFFAKDFKEDFFQGFFF